MVTEQEQYRLYMILQQLRQIRWNSTLQMVTNLEYTTMLAVAHAHVTHPERPGIYVSALAKELSTSVSMVSKLLSSLEKKNWIRRTVDPESRRNTFVSLSDEGKTLLKEELGRTMAATEQVFQKMGQENVRSFLDGAQLLADCYAEVLGTD